MSAIELPSQKDLQNKHRSSRRNPASFPAEVTSTALNGPALWVCSSSNSCVNLSKSDVPVHDNSSATLQKVSSACRRACSSTVVVVVVVDAVVVMEVVVDVGHAGGTGLQCLVSLVGSGHAWPPCLAWLTTEKDRTCLPERPGLLASTQVIEQGDHDDHAPSQSMGGGVVTALVVVVVCFFVVVDVVVDVVATGGGVGQAMLAQCTSE